MYYFGYGNPDEALAHLCASPPSRVGVDVETASKTDNTPIGVAIALSQRESFYFPLWPDTDPDIPWEAIIQNPAVCKAFHNAIFDLYVLGLTEVELGPMDTVNIADTAIMLRLVPFANVGLEQVQSLVGRSDIISAGDMLKMKSKMTDYPENFLARKCAIDAEVTVELYDKYLSRSDMPYHDEEMKVIPILIRMSNRGIRIDESLRAELEGELQIDVDRIFKECELEGFNPGSPQQVGYILAKRGNMLPMRKRRGLKGFKFTATTDVNALELVSDPMAATILEYRKKAKLLSTYIKPLAGEDRIYTEFHLDAITSRISSRKRNLQNLPQGKVRNMLLPDCGIFTDMDFSQIELRILAHLSGDERMQQIYEDDGDIHQFVAEFLGIQRKLAKNVQFGMVYGATASTLRETAKIKDTKVCNRLIDKWFNMFPQAEKFIKETQYYGLRDGYITTMGGRKILLRQENEDAMKRKAINYRIQGTAAEIMKKAIRATQYLLQVLTVHDELLFEGDMTGPLSSLGLERLTEVYTPYTVKLLDKWE